MNTPMTSALCLGFAAVTGQIMVVRELTSLFSGFDPVIGMIYASWLLWTGLGAWGGRFALSRDTPARTAGVLSLLGLLTPATLIAARTAREMWGIGLGEFPSAIQAVTVSLAVTAPFCLVSGALFTLCWSGIDTRSGSNRLQVYAAESAGAALGGIFFHFVLLPCLPGLWSAWAVFFLLSGAATIIAFRNSIRMLLRLLCAACFTAACACAVLIPFTERAVLKIQWGNDARAAAWTPYHNLVVLESGGLSTFLADGTWLFSSPDRESAEWGAHLPALMHPEPRSVLLMGGNLFAQARLLMSHPSVERIDFVDPDPATIEFARRHLPPEQTSVADSPKVRLHHRDGAVFLKNTLEKWDLISVNLGEPVNADSNRFHSVEFYRNVRSALEPDGIFTFPAAAAPDALGPLQERFIRSMAATLMAVFPRITAIPGTDIRFAASTASSVEDLSASLLNARMVQRGINALHVRPDSLSDRFSPFRTAALRSIIHDPDNSDINSDFRPVALFNGILLWAAAMDPHLPDALISLRNSGRHLPWLGIAGLLIFMALTCSGNEPSSPKSIVAGWSVFTAGGTCMALTLALLFGYRVLNGGFYGALAILTGANMAGLGLGALQAARMRPTSGRLYIVQGTICLLALIPILLFPLLEHSAPQALMLPIFTLCSLFIGLAGGLHFGIAAGLHSLLCTGRSAEGGEGGMLYCADLLGGMVCSLLFSMVMLPVFGLNTGLFAMAALCAGNLVLSMRKWGMMKP